MRSKHTLYLSFFLSKFNFQSRRLFSLFFFLVSGLYSFEASAQTATIVNARHETLDQRTVEVLFDNTIQSAPPPSINGWSVSIGGTPVTVNSVTVLGTRVQVQFDATAVNGVPYILTAQSAAGVTVSYNPVAAGSNTLTNGSGNEINAFTGVVSQNNYVFTCSELNFYQQGIFTGATADICAPVVMNFFQFQYQLSLRFRNSTSFSFTPMKYAIAWGDATAVDFTPYQSDLLGTAAPTFIDPTGFAGSPGVVLTSRPTHTYPATTTPTPSICSWDMQLTPYYNGVATCFTLRTSKIFATYDTDNANSGVLNLPPSVANSNLVCLGDNVNMRFSDATNLNCRLAAPEADVPNDLARWIRVVYGSTNNASGNIADIWVGGTHQVTANADEGPILDAGGYFPTGAGGIGVPDFNGVIRLPTPVNASTLTTYMQQITTTATTFHEVGERFYVRLDYWDICNPYNAGSPNANRVSIENYVEIINSPNPPTVNNPILCETAANASFEITATGAGAGTLTYTWYLDAAKTTVLQAASTDNTFNPVTEGPVGNRINKAVTGSQTFTRYVTVTQGSNNCTSQPQTITIRIDDSNTAGVIAHPDGASPITVCSGYDPGAFTSTTAGTGGAPGGTFTYQWQSATNAAFSAGVTNIPGATTDVFNPPAVTSNIFYRRQVISGSCATVDSNIIGFLADSPVLGGTIATNQTICATPGDPANLTSSAGASGGSNTGVYNYQWENSTDGVVFNTIGGATSATYNPPAGVTQTTHYRRRVTSGVCSADGPDAGTDPDNLAYSNTIIVTVHQDNNPGAIGNPQIICTGDNPTVLTNVTSASGGDGTNYAYQWQQAAALAGPFSDIAGQTGTTYDPPALASTTFYRRRVRSPGPVTTTCTEAFTNVIEVTVGPRPSATVTGGGAACDGNPAPDIIWTFSGATSYSFTIDRPAPDADIVVTNHTASTYTLSGQTTAGSYQLSALSNFASGCTSISLGGAATVTIAGGSPDVDGTPSIAPTEACINGTSATDPVLSLKLTVAFANTNGFILNYTIDGGANSTKTFNTDATGLPTAAMSFSEIALNTVGSHTIRLVSIQSPAGCLRLVGLNLTYIVRPLPVIGTQPIAQEVCVAGNTSFTVAATTGGGATSTDIQWQISTTGSGGPFTNLTNVAPYSNVTTSTLTITAAPAGLNGNFYRAVATGVFPTSFSCPTISNAVALTVRPYATITAQPPTRVLCSGENTTFGVTANVAGPSTITGYQWQISTAGAGGPYTDLTNVAPYSNVTTATMTITGATTALSGNHYRVNITTTGSCAQPSNPGPLTVNPLPVSNAISPIVCEDIVHVLGSPSVGTGEATNVDLAQFSASIADLPGAPVEVPFGFEVLYYQDLAHTVQITTPTTISAGEQIFTRVRNMTTNCFTDRTITFTVRTQPSRANFTVQICEDNPPGSLVASGINLTSYEATVAGGIVANRNVEWYTDNALTALIPAGALPNQEQNYSISATTTLFAKIIDTTPGTPGCNSVAELKLEYQPRPNANTIRDGAGVALGATYTVCASNNLVFLQIDPTINPGSTYTWTLPTPPPLSTDPGYFELLTGTNGFFIILRFPSLNPSPGIPISVTERLGTASCAGTTISTSVIVEGSPSAPVISGPTTVCANSPVTYTVPFVSGDTYSWTVPPGATITSFPITNTISVQMSTFSGNVTVTVANSTGCVAPPSTPLAVTVVTKPVMTSAPSNILCSGQAPDDVHTLTASLGGTTYRWEIISISGFVSGASVGDTDGSVLGSNTPGAANIDSRDLTNTSGVNAAVIYKVTPVSPPTSGVYCEGNQQNVTITIQPEPNLLLTPKTVCSNEPANYEIRLATAGLPTGTQFTWAAPTMSDLSVQGTSGTNVPAGASGTIHINDSFLNTTAGTITATYTISATSAAGCSSNQPLASRQVVITINPKPLVATNLDKAVCSDEAIALTLNTAAGSTTAGSYSIVSSTIAGLLTPNAGNATVPQGTVTAGYLANDKFTNTSGGPLLVTYLVNAKGTAILGQCQGPDQLITLTINTGPATNSVTDEVCSDVAGGNTYVEDLTSLQPLVNSNGTLTFEWYTDAAATSAIPVGSLTAYPLQDGQPVYVKVHNGVGTCAKIQPVEYVVNPTPAVTASITSNYSGFNVRCIGSADGAITADPATLGTPNYMYSIDGSSFFAGRIFNGLAASNNPFVVTVRDDQGCTATSAPMTLTEPPVMAAPISVTSNYNGRQLSCPGEDDGQITVLASGGTGSGYSYKLIETGATNLTGVFNGLTQGVYTVIVTDKAPNNCTITTGSVTITPPPVIVASATMTSPTTCNGDSDGEIQALASGGTLVAPNNYTFTINPGGTSNTIGTFTGLAASATPYVISVQDDNGCTVQSNGVVVTQPAVLTAFASVTSNYNGSQITCNGANDAIITVTANGGNSGYTYVFNGLPANATGNGTGVYTGVNPGTYTVTVTDAEGCGQTTGSVTVNQPSPIAIQTFITNAISCFGDTNGQISLIATGGTGAHTYVRNDGPVANPGPESNSSGVFSSLAQFTYNFTVRDLNNCPATAAVVLNQPALLTATAAVTSDYNGSDISCPTSLDGVVQITANGGTVPYSYVMIAPSTGVPNSTGTFNGLGANNYGFRVTDSHNCQVLPTVSVVAPTAVQIDIAQVTSNYTGQHISCTNATDAVITIGASGGSPGSPVAYRYTLNLTANSSGLTDGTFENVASGSYTLTATDGNSCTATSPVVVVNAYPVINFPAAAIALYNGGREISCNGASDGQITSTPSGGAGGWTSFVIAPVAGVNAGTGVFTGLPANSYVISAADANGCPASTASVTVHQPEVLVASASIQAGLTCFNSTNASVLASAVGGTANYTFSINSAPVQTSTPEPSSHTFTNLGPNAGYLVTVTDVNNCTDDVTVSPIVAPSQPVITASVTSKLLTAYHGNDITCFGADDAIITAVHTAGTGTGSLTYGLVGNTSGQFTGIFSQVGPGTSTITATDVNGCAAVPVDVPVVEPAQLVATIVSGLNYGGFEIKCFNESNGRILVTTIGGTGNPLSTDFKYTLLQAPSNVVDLTNGDVRFNNLRANEYEARVQDINSCTAISNLIELEQPELITVNISITSNYGVDGTDISCNGASDGVVGVAATIVGGTGLDGGGDGSGIIDYHYILNDRNNVAITDATHPGYTSGVFTGLTNERYTITVIDSNVCTQRSFPVTLVQPSVLQPGFVGSDQNICINQATPALTTFEEFSEPFGGNGSYQYQWKFSTTSATGPFSNVPSGGNTAEYLETIAPTVTTYYVREVSLGGGAAASCPIVVSSPVKVTVNELPTANITLSRPDPICEGSSFLVNMNFVTGALPFTYTYTTLDTEGTTGGDTGVGGNSLPIFVTDYQAETTYTLTNLVDRNGCIATAMPVARTVGIIKFSADFDILGPNPQCSGTPFVFQHRNDNNVTYTFSWPDGTSRVVLGDGSPQPDTVRRSFTAFDPGQTAELPVLLKAEVAGCNPKTTSEIIKLYPAIIPNIVVTEDNLCSGSTVLITNNTLGGDIHNWTITRTNDGQVEAGFPISDASALNKSFVINNTTAFNPATYLISYNISNDPGQGNGNCTNSTSVSVDVYTNIIAKIGSPKDPVQTIQRWGESDAGDNGVMGVDGSGKNFMRITFDNASTPTPPTTGVEYTWVFSNNNANTPPETFTTNADPFFYDYKNPGVGKRANLTVVNLAAIGNVPGGCSDTDQFIFEIEIPPIVANFTVAPSIICVTDTIKMTNLSTPLYNQWTIVNESTGGIPLPSNDFEPKFTLSEAGRYRISLKVRNPDFPDEDAYYTHAPDQFVNAYDKPIASFITSPYPNVFVPDQELRTDNRSQTAFDVIDNVSIPIHYEWDFGDGTKLVSGDNPSIADPNSNHSPVHQYKTENGPGYLIELIAVNVHGTGAAAVRCTDMDTVRIYARAAGTSKVPNAFTPNPGGPSGGIVDEDGTTINDVFLPITKGVKEFQMQIFDRWGNLVFESLQQTRGWDGYDRKGNLMPAGVYVYKLVLRMANDQRTTQVGDVTLIR